jgi:hypothetical protein
MYLATEKYIFKTNVSFLIPKEFWINIFLPVRTQPTQWATPLQLHKYIWNPLYENIRNYKRSIIWFNTSVVVKLST